MLIILILFIFAFLNYCGLPVAKYLKLVDEANKFTRRLESLKQHFNLQSQMYLHDQHSCFCFEILSISFRLATAGQAKRTRKQVNRLPCGNVAILCARKSKTDTEQLVGLRIKSPSKTKTSNGTFFVYQCIYNCLDRFQMLLTFVLRRWMFPV